MNSYRIILHNTLNKDKISFAFVKLYFKTPVKQAMNFLFAKQD